MKDLQPAALKYWDEHSISDPVKLYEQHADAFMAELGMNNLQKARFKARLEMCQAVSFEAGNFGTWTGTEWKMPAETEAPAANPFAAMLEAATSEGKDSEDAAAVDTMKGKDREEEHTRPGNDRLEKQPLRAKPQL